MNTTDTDPLLSAIGRQTGDLCSRVEDLRRAVEGDVSTLDKARVLLALSDATDALDALLDKLGGFEDLLPEDAG